MPQDNFHFTRGDLRSTGKKGTTPGFTAPSPFSLRCQDNTSISQARIGGPRGCDPGQGGWWGGMKLFLPMPPTRYLPQTGAWQIPSASQSGWLATSSKLPSLSKTDSHESFKTSRRSRKDTDIFPHTKNKKETIIRKRKEEESGA